MSRRDVPSETVGLLIDQELREFLHSGVACVVGTHDSQLFPEICRAWGPRVAGDGATIELFVDKEPGALTLANLRAVDLIAVTFVNPIDYRSVQLKGRALKLGGDEPDGEERERIQRHREAFADNCLVHGIPREVVRNFWTFEVTRLSFAAREAFDQTPGPVAGRSL